MMSIGTRLMTAIAPLQSRSSSWDDRDGTGRDWRVDTALVRSDKRPPPTINPQITPKPTKVPMITFAKVLPIPAFGCGAKQTRQVGHVAFDLRSSLGHSIDCEQFGHVVLKYSSLMSIHRNRLVQRGSRLRSFSSRGDQSIDSTKYHEPATPNRSDADERPNGGGTRTPRKNEDEYTGDSDHGSKPEETGAGLTKVFAFASRDYLVDEKTSLALAQVVDHTLIVET
jgi:hypothetical protein